eukprot:1155916-Pelagomonas_calceolata.AAC.11
MWTVYLMRRPHFPRYVDWTSPQDQAAARKGGEQQTPTARQRPGLSTCNKAFEGGEALPGAAGADRLLAACGRQCHYSQHDCSGCSDAPAGVHIRGQES